MGIYFDRSAGIVYLPFRPGADGATLNSEPTDWGLIDFDAEGNVCGAEIWKPAAVLPPDLLEALPEPPPMRRRNED
jgi:uncharacterized protein YuzE